MNSIPNPDGWLDVFTIIAVVLITAVPSWLAARNQKTIQAVKDQVVNGHTTPMRADLDSLREDIGGMRDEMRGGFSALRSDLAEERIARRSGDDMLRDQIGRNSPPNQ